MSLSNEEVKKIARLARIKVEEEQLPKFGAEMNQILAWFEELQQVNTDDVAPTYSTTQADLPMRKDEVTDGGIQADILKNAPESEFGCFTVPKVVE